ncbi:MAG: DUF2169 domain-containing protein [Deltaproteobacteria bacterium]|nr:DUF2169 domain-containing protein [Deltaproteobacteria bacterium]
MWEIKNKTPFASNSGFVRNQNGEEIWIVIVKATYDIAPEGFLTPSEEQPDVCLLDEFYGDPGISSIKYPGDIVLTKEKTDVILNGHAYSKKSTKKKTVKLKFGNKINKKLVVRGDSHYFRFLLLYGSPRKKFIKTPIRYEHTYGGQREDFKKRWKHNSVGAGYIERKGELTPGINLPFRPGKSTGYGAIAQNWFPRYKYGGTYNKKWEETQKPFLPLDFNNKFNQVAPPDQQVDVSGNEIVELTNLTPDGFLKFLLPQDKFTITTFMDGEEYEQEPELHTIIIEPDYPRVTMTWQISFNCNLKEEQITHALVKQGNL